MPDPDNPPTAEAAGEGESVADLLDELHDILREAVDELPELAYEEQGLRQHSEASVGAYPADPLSSSRTTLADRCARAADRLRGKLPAATPQQPTEAAGEDGAR